MVECKCVSLLQSRGIIRGFQESPKRNPESPPSSLNWLTVSAATYAYFRR